MTSGSLFSLETIGIFPPHFLVALGFSLLIVCRRRYLWTPLFAVDQKANLYGKSGQPAEVNVWSTRHQVNSSRVTSWLFSSRCRVRVRVMVKVRVGRCIVLDVWY